jgi:hypothetical protein
VVFDDTLGEVEVGNAICMVSRSGIVRVRTVGAVHNGLSGRQPEVPTIIILVVPAYPKVTNAILILLHRAILERLSSRVL